MPALANQQECLLWFKSSSACGKFFAKAAISNYSCSAFKIAIDVQTQSNEFEN